MAEIGRFDLPDHGAKHQCTLDACFHKIPVALGRWLCAQHASVGHLGTKPTHGWCG